MRALLLHYELVTFVTCSYPIVSFSHYSFYFQMVDASKVRYWDSDHLICSFFFDFGDFFLIFNYWVKISFHDLELFWVSSFEGELSQVVCYQINLFWYVFDCTIFYILIIPWAIFRFLFISSSFVTYSSLTWLITSLKHN